MNSKKRFAVIWGLLTFVLGACSMVVPARDNAQWESTVQGVKVQWRWTEPGGLTRHGPYTAGFAVGGYQGSCVVDIDPLYSRSELVQVAAHEVGHCLQFHYGLPGYPRPDLGEHYASGKEGFAESYARLYVRECGLSAAPLGWTDYAVARCAEAPDPRTVTGTE